MNNLTIEEVKAVTPSKLRGTITQEFVDKINSLSNDPIVAKSIKDNFISYTHVLADGKYDVQEYLNAVKYISYKLFGLSNFDAYVKTFPKRYTALQAKGVSISDIHNYVKAYNKTKLVNIIREQTLVPTWVLNSDCYQEAINTQVELMRDAKSEKVRAMAADSLLNHLKRPDAIGPMINIDMRSSGIDDLKDQLVKLAQQQKELIQQGTLTPKQIVEMDINDAEIIEPEKK